MTADFQTAMAMAQSTPIVMPHQTDNLAAAKKAATEFEGTFVSQFLNEMWDGIPTDGMFGGGQGEEMFRSLMLDQYGKQIAQQDGFGLSSAITRELLKTQEVKQ